MGRLDYEKILKENLTESAFEIITENERSFSLWLDRVKFNAKRCDELFRELKSYKDAEKQGLLLRLPCKVGDDVWMIEQLDDLVFDMLPLKVGRIMFMTTQTKRENKISATIGAEDMITGQLFTFKYPFDFLFFTPEEAEAKLQEVRGNRQ